MCLDSVRDRRRVLSVPALKLVMVVASGSPIVGLRFGFREGFWRRRIATTMSALRVIVR